MFAKELESKGDNQQNIKKFFFFLIDDNLKYTQWNP